MLWKIIVIFVILPILGKTYASKKSGGGAISQKNPESSPEPSSGDKRKQEMPLTEGKKQKVTDPTLKNLG